MSNCKLGLAEEEVVITGSAFPLQGTLTRPDTTQKRPAILIIPGTGTSDRDGSNRLFKVPFYKELAHFLSNLGYITLRYDKRGVGKSLGDYYETGFWDLVDDGAACVEFLKARPDVERVIILGHSEGCFIAPAVHTRTEVQGMILLSGACESAKTAFPRQTEMVLKELQELPGLKGALVRKLNVAKKQRKQADKLMKRILESEKPWIRILWKKINAKWMREHFAYNVVDELPYVHCPTLAISGSKDVQVPPEHARLLAETVSGESEWHIIDGMTHILRKTSEEVSMLSVVKTYKRLITEPMAPELQLLLQQWLYRHFTYQDTTSVS